MVNQEYRPVADLAKAIEELLSGLDKFRVYVDENRKEIDIEYSVYVYTSTPISDLLCFELRDDVGQVIRQKYFK